GWRRRPPPASCPCPRRSPPRRGHHGGRPDVRTWPDAPGRRPRPGSGSARLRADLVDGRRPHLCPGRPGATAGPALRPRPGVPAEPFVTAPYPSGEQHAISFGEQTAVVVEVGGGLREYRVDGFDVV